MTHGIILAVCIAMLDGVESHVSPLLRPSAGRARSYPRELESEVTLDDGTFLRIRPIRPDDERRLVDLYSRLSPQSAYQRFFAIMKQLPSRWASILANVDYRRRLALVAERIPREAGFTGDPQIVGVGRYEATERVDTAEVAFVVEDDWQGRGLGRILLREVLRAGQARGIERFQAFVLADNRRMLRMLVRHTHVVERSVDAGVASLLLQPAPPRRSDA